MKWVSERRFLHFIEDIKKLFAYKKELPTKLSQLENDCNFGGASDEQIAQAIDKHFEQNPIKVPTKTSDLENDSEFVTSQATIDVYTYINDIRDTIDVMVFDTQKDVDSLKKDMDDKVNSGYLDERLDGVATEQYVDEKIESCATEQDVRDAIHTSNAYAEELFNSIVNGNEVAY